jgi:hypothetical protein
MESAQQVAQISEECKNFEPTTAEEFLTIPNGEYQRLIFEGVELRTKEEDHMDNFREYCKENNITIPEGYDDDKKFILRILQGKKWKYDVSAKVMLEHNEWKLKTYPLSYDPVKDMLNDGFIYGAGRDNKFRPVIVINCAKCMAHGPTANDALIAACTYFMD